MTKQVDWRMLGRKQKQKDFRRLKEQGIYAIGTDFDLLRLLELGKELFAVKFVLEKRFETERTEGEKIALADLTSAIETIELLLSSDTEYGYFVPRDVDMDLWLDNYCMRERNKP